MRSRPQRAHLRSPALVMSFQSPVSERDSLWGHEIIKSGPRVPDV